MKLTLSFVCVAIALLQMTAASPVVKDVEKRAQKAFPYLVAEDPSDAEVPPNKAFTNVAAEKSRDVADPPAKSFSYIVAEEAREVEPPNNGPLKEGPSNEAPPNNGPLKEGPPNEAPPTKGSPPPTQQGSLKKAL
ncbi:uncharacterized protein F5147DRAFT_656144 [Suillus discolor]|uniref:Uncharacterized protein n=1 Tax=Suillus discolor TaxID=1912936 RepID=A0A9P7F0I0_9AGAM|nr:uncharacterized protein F5147DRAFT_656144 [Suillus discolor]KAG2098260.1 hypothetical protein F5147DRAFT_656144 [Suillus discolor]